MAQRGQKHPPPPRVTSAQACGDIGDTPLQAISSWTLSSWSPVPRDPLSPDTWDVGTLGTCVTEEWGLLRPGFFKCREVPSPINNGHMGDTRNTLVLAATPKLGHIGQWDIEDTWHRGMVTPFAWLLGARGSPKSSQSRDMRTHLPWSSAAGTPCVPIPRTREHQGTVGTPLSWSLAPVDTLGPNTWVMGTPGTCDSWEGGQFRGPWGYGDQGGPWRHGDVPMASPC